jgi:hypothetical protein
MLDSEQLEYYPSLPRIYYVVYGVSFLFLFVLIAKYWKRSDNGKNRLRREYV